MEIAIIAKAIKELTVFAASKLKLLDETRQNAIKLTEELQRIQKAITYWEEKQVLTKTEEEQKKDAEKLAEETVSLLDEYKQLRGAGSEGGSEFLTKLWEFVQYCIQYCIPSTSPTSRSMSEMGKDIQKILGKMEKIKISGDAVKERAVLRLSSKNYYSGTTPMIDYSRDEQKRQITMGAKQLTIAWGENSRYWKFSSNPTSKKFSVVAELIRVCWLDIKCNVETKNLLKGRKYGVYLVFKLTNVNYGLESVVGYVRNVEAEAEAEACAEAEAVKEATSLHLQSASTKRTDGWMEVKLGEIYNDDDDDDDDDGTVEARVFELSDDWKAGLTVAGIVFRHDITHGR